MPCSWRWGRATPGVVLAFALILGWHGWQQRRASALEQSSIAYDAVLVALGEGGAGRRAGVRADPGLAVVAAAPRERARTELDRLRCRARGAGGGRRRASCWRSR